MRSIPHLGLSTRFHTLALGAGLLVSLVGSSALQAQMPDPARVVRIPASTQPVVALPVQMAGPTILIPGQTASGTKLADTLIYQGTVMSGDFCTVTRTEQSQTQTTGNATVSVTASVTVTCDVQITTTP